MAVKGHINKRLSDVSIQTPQGEFVGQHLFPELPVDKGSDEYTIYDKGNLFKNVDDTMSKMSEAKLVQMAETNASYTCKDRALAGFVAQTDMDNADDPLNPKMDETEVVTSAILLNREIRHAALATSLSNTSSPVTKWSAGGTPVKDVQNAIDSLIVAPNTAIISKPVFDALKFNSDVLAKYQGGNTGIQKATIEMLKTLWDLDNIYIGDAQKNATKATKDPVLSRVWGKSMILARVSPRMSKKTQTLGWTFAQKINGRKTFQVREIDEPKKGVGGGMLIQVEHRSIEKIVAQDFGYHLSDCIA